MMSKLAHSHQPSMDKIEAANRAREGIYKCERCDGTGYREPPFSSSNWQCPECDGEGIVCGEPS